MKIEEISNYEQWTSFFQELESPTFLQAWEWGDLQEKNGHKVLRIGAYRKSKLCGIAQVIHIKAKRGNFLFLPHGPICNSNEVLMFLINHLHSLGKQLGCSYIRVSPILVDTPENEQLFRTLGFRKSPIHMHAENIWLLGIDKNEEVLLSEMRKTTRNLIRRAIKDGVQIEKTKNKAALKDFMKTYVITAKREHFTPFSKKFIENEFEAFSKKDNAIILNGRLSKHEKCLSSAVILFTKSSAFYHQGASLHSKYPVTYLMQWTAILEAKRRNCVLYNFWGIAPNENVKHPWYGLTQFKKGFGGYQVDYLPAQDYVLSSKYYLSFMYEKLQRLRRRL